MAPMPAFPRAELRLEMEQEELAAYLAEFERGVEEDVVMLGSISLEEVQEEERRLRDEHVTYLQQEAANKRKREQQLLQRQEEVKERVALYVRQRRKEIAEREVSTALGGRGVWRLAWKEVFAEKVVTFTRRLLTPSLSWCHLKTTNKSVKIEPLSLFFSFSFFPHWKGEGDAALGMERGLYREGGDFHKEIVNPFTVVMSLEND